VSIANGGLTAAFSGALIAGGSGDSVAVAGVNNFKTELVTHEGEHFIIEVDCIEAAASAGGSIGRMTAETCVKVRGLKINGQAIAVTGAANQRVVVGEECVFIINERLTVTDNNDADALASGLHFYLCDCIEGWLARVDAGVTLVAKNHRPDCKTPRDHDARDCDREWEKQKEKDKDKNKDKDKDKKGGNDRDDDKKDKDKKGNGRG
jgi:hypothetical protein